MQISRHIPRGSVKVADKASDAVAYIYTSPRGLCAKVFYGRQSKPVAHHLYRNEAERTASVTRLFTARQLRAEYMAKRKADGLAMARKVEVGTAFYTSWGYDQTNIDWYEITALVGKTSAKVRRIATLDASKGNEAWATGKSVPDLGNYKGPEQLVRVRGDGFKVDGHYAHIWDGKPKNWTAYA